MHEIIAALEPFLIQQAGLKPANIVYIPCSGLSGENLVASSEQALKTWYNGPTMLTQLDMLDVPPKLCDRPLRMTVTDVFKGGLMGAAVGGISVTGRIDQGALQVSSEVISGGGAVDT